jgi:hypothetical protein
MRIDEGIKHKGKPFHIPECSRDELPGLFRDLGFKVGAEIGVLRGTYTKHFCEAGLKMYAIDPWMAFKGQGRSNREQIFHDANYDFTLQSLNKFIESGLCEIVRLTSEDAKKNFRNNSLDFVYIDGNHDFPHVAHDLYEWSFRVRSGGIVSGHDYFDTWKGARNTVCHVAAVVDSYTTLYGIENFWTIGGHAKRGNDNFKSFFWFKE